MNNTASCDGEGQKTVFEVEDGVTVKNLIIAGGIVAGSGIVCLGNCTLDHVYWEGPEEFRQGPAAGGAGNAGSMWPRTPVLAPHPPPSTRPLSVLCSESMRAPGTWGEQAGQTF